MVLSVVKHSLPLHLAMFDRLFNCCIEKLHIAAKLMIVKQLAFWVNVYINYVRICHIIVVTDLNDIWQEHTINNGLTSK